MNVAEVIDGKGNGIITHASVKANTCADSSMAGQYMEEQPDNGPRQVFTADGAYNSKRLEELAAQKNIDIQTTSLTGAEPHDIGKIKKYLSSVSLSVSECHVFFARQLFPLAAEQNGCCKTYMAAV